MSETVSLTLWAANAGQALSGRVAWLARLEKIALEARAAGSQMLVLPEYAGEASLLWQDPVPAETAQVAAMAREGAALMAPMQEIARDAGIDILAGTWTAAEGRGFVNRATLLFADGHAPVTQDKLCLTPAEQDPAGWNVTPARHLEVFQWQGLTCVILICLDIELPGLSARLAHEVPDLDLILVPSNTGKLSGYSRVFGCAKARAVELLTVVATVGAVGTVGTPINRSNVSAAAVYLPCEEALGFEGRFAELAPVAEAEDEGPRLHARDIPVGAVRRLRREGAEVWPGAWDAAPVTICRREVASARRAG